MGFNLVELRLFALPRNLIANEQAERRRSASEAASLMPHEVLQQAENSRSCCEKCNLSVM